MPDYTPIQQNTGSYVPTTTILDVSRIQEVEVTSPEFKELLVRLYQTVNNISLVLNTKETGYYIEEEFVTGNLYFNPASSNQLDLRPSFAKTINIGALGAGVTAIAHNIPITATYTFVGRYGWASDNVGFNYYPLPWASAAGATNIELRVSATQVVITNNSGINFTSCIVTLEYLKN